MCQDPLLTPNFLIPSTPSSPYLSPTTIKTPPASSPASPHSPHCSAHPPPAATPPPTTGDRVLGRNPGRHARRGGTSGPYAGQGRQACARRCSCGSRGPNRPSELGPRRARPRWRGRGCWPRPPAAQRRWRWRARRPRVGPDGSGGGGVVGRGGSGGSDVGGGGGDDGGRGWSCLGGVDAARTGENGEEVAGVGWKGGAGGAEAAPEASLPLLVGGI